MSHALALSSLSPAIQAHLALASTALVLGPLVLWRRKGTAGHKRLGYLWVLVMLGAAASSLFIRDFRLPNLAGYTPIHLLSLLTFAGIAGAMAAVLSGRIALHQRAMRQVYMGACVGAGLFALLPGRYLGDLLWHHGLGLV
jgi:uncharacterized membrane protein